MTNRIPTEKIFHKASKQFHFEITAKWLEMLSTAFTYVLVDLQNETLINFITVRQTFRYFTFESSDTIESLYLIMLPSVVLKYALPVSS